MKVNSHKHVIQYLRDKGDIWNKRITTRFKPSPPLQLKWGMWDLLDTISTNKNAFHHNNSFKLGIGLKLNEGIVVGFFSLS